MRRGGVPYFATMRSNRLLATLTLLAAALLQGCVAFGPVVGDGERGAPAFYVSRNDGPLLSLEVSRQSVEGWVTLWQVTGRSSAREIEYCVTPEGMRASGNCAPTGDRGEVYRAVVRVETARGGVRVRRSFWIWNPDVQVCGPPRRCQRMLLEGVVN